MEKNDEHLRYRILDAHLMLSINALHHITTSGRRRQPLQYSNCSSPRLSRRPH